MTYEQAKRRLEENDIFEKEYGKDAEAIELAIRALEMQIPKEPTLEEHDFCGEDYVTRKVVHEMCPGCHRVLSFGCAMEWCMYCGQKIDWREKR